MMGMKFFYMPCDFYAGQFTKTAFPKFRGFNSRIALWFISWLNKYSKIFLSVLVRDFEKTFTETEIVVPRNSNGDLALEYIESYIQEIEHVRTRELDAYIKSIGFDDCELNIEEIDALNNTNAIKFKEFKIGKLYNKVILKKKVFNKRKDSRQIPNHKYCLPLVNAKHGDNGIMYYGDPNIFDSVEMSIDIVQNGAVATGDVYPQPQQTGVLWDAYLIQASHHQDNAETLMYFSTVIAKSIKKKYTYDNKAYWEKVKEDNIVLPVTSSGEIDYHFMEVYIRAQEKLAIQRVKDWRVKEISATKDIIDNNVPVTPFIPLHQTHSYELSEEYYAPMMVAEDIFIPGSLEVRLPKTRREELLAGNLDLILMYAISPVARQKTESAGRIALGIKEDKLTDEAIKAFESVKHIMFHYWKNETAIPFALTSPIRMVSKKDVPEGYLMRQEKDAEQFLLIEYDPMNEPAFDDFNIMAIQQNGKNRYTPFVSTVRSIIL